MRTDDVAQPCDDLGKPVSFLDATIRGRSGIRPVRDHLNGREKQTMAEESSAGFSEQLEKRMKAIQDQWEAQRKAVADMVERQKKAIEDLFRRKPE